MDRGRAQQSGTFGQPPQTKSKKFKIPTDNCCLLRPTSKNKIALAFFKVAYPYNSYQGHFIFKVQNPLYMLISIELSTIDWDFIFEVKPSKKHVINLEVKNITKP